MNARGCVVLWWCCAVPHHAVLCRAMPFHAVPRRAMPRHAVQHQLLALPMPKAVPGSGSCPGEAASACPSPFLPRLISCDPAQGAGTTSGPGPCKQLSRVSCQLFAYNCRTVLRSSPEGPVRGHRVTTRSLPQGYGAEAGPASSPRHRNTSAASGPHRARAPGEVPGEAWLQPGAARCPGRLCLTQGSAPCPAPRTPSPPLEPGQGPGRWRGREAPARRLNVQSEHGAGRQGSVPHAAHSTGL